MSCFKGSYCENNKKLKLTGSQINLTSRSDQTVLGSLSNRTRPCSAAYSCTTNFESKANYIRPRSADYSNLNSSRSESFQWPLVHSGESKITVSNFIDSSSKLLQNLLETHGQITPHFEGRYSKAFNNRETEGTIAQKCLEADKNFEFEKETVDLPEVAEEKTVRFCEHLDLLSKKKICKKCTSFRGNENFHSCLKNKFKYSCQESHFFQRSVKDLDDEKKSEIHGIYEQDDQSETEDLKLFHSDAENSESKEQTNEGNLCEDWEKLQNECINKKFEEVVANSNNVMALQTTAPHLEAEHLDNKSSEKSDTVTQSPDEEHSKTDSDVNAVDTKFDCTLEKIDIGDSTYDEIVHLLQSLEEEDSESVNLESKQDSAVEITAVEVSPEEKNDYFSAVSSYLEEVERNDNSFPENYMITEKWNSKHITSPRLEELLNKNSVELAHEVFSLKIQIEDQKKGIKLLKDTLGEMKEAKKVIELEHQEALQKVSSEAENLVQRHQKFIKQLLNEKKNLNNTVSKLVQDLKSGEERYKRNIKAMEEKHLIEIKRAKEAQAVADKIRREKWMENKTQKIKEMTVKGLEPELSRMAARQQEEVTELRNLHKAELEAVELRAARRNSELMDELRAELTKEKERAIAKETSTLRTTMEKDFEDERNKFQQYYQNLKERIRKQEEKLSNQEFEFQQRLLDFKQEEEKKRQKIIREHEEKLEEVRRQHSVELRNLKEAAEEEREVALNNYKKLQAIKFNEREVELHQQYKKERDQEIEMVIETLEKESTQVQLEINLASESKIKKLKDKMEAEIKEIEASEASLKDKLTETKFKLSEKEDVITELNSQIRQLQTELTFVKRSCDEMSLEKMKMKEIIREEFESSIKGFAKEKENLEKDIVALKELHVKELAKRDQLNVQAKYEMQKELTRVYSRIKTAVNKKEKIIESLREENEAINQKCRQLEYMLDQQRRNLLLQEAHAYTETIFSRSRHPNYPFT